MASYRSRRRHSQMYSHRPLVAFLLIASFGILFAGCGGPADSGTEINADEFTFTEDDVARFRELVNEDGEEVGVTGTASVVPVLKVDDEGEGEIPVLDLSQNSTYQAIRSGPGAVGENMFRVTNTFLNVRSGARVTAPAIDRLDKGDAVKVVEFVDAAWAKIELPRGETGFVSSRYIAKLTSEEKLAEERAKYEGQYFVNFGFLNVRKDADSSSEKLGELQGQMIVKPITMDDVWARIPFDGKEGYVAVQYLSPFEPNFLVRQDTYALPILHYRLVESEVLDVLTQHLGALSEAGIKVLTMRDFYDLLLEQEDKDTRIDPKAVVVAISDITADNVDDMSDVLRASNVDTTLYIQTDQIGLNGITEKTILTLLANGNDLQSAGHTGDDLRSLTNAQTELELKQSRQILEKMTNREVFSIAYPWGGVNERVMGLAADAGYLLGVGSAPERTFRREQFLRLPSFVVTSSLTSDDVLRIAKGGE